MIQRQRGQGDASPAPDHFLIVEARYYDRIGAMLLAGAEEALTGAGATFDVIQVPGALEIPLAIAFVLDGAAGRGRPYGGAVALGCIVRGETYHFEIVSNESARGLMQVGIARGAAVGNGILTVDDEAQAIARANPREGNKGGEAALAMLSLWRIREDARRAREARPAARAAR